MLALSLRKKSDTTIAQSTRRQNKSDNNIKQATTIFTTLVIKDTSVESHVHKRNRKQEN